MHSRPRQLAFTIRAWGGCRRGAGRKPVGPKAGVPHLRRPHHDPRRPLHVTLRAVAGLPSFRASYVFPAVRAGLAAASRDTFRVAHFSVQSNHVHVLVEAESTESLSRGMRGLAIRVAKAVNRVLSRRGRVWADRFHARALSTPREVRRALIYVLMNFRKHTGTERGIDPCSSARWFVGWRNGSSPRDTPPVAPVRTWFLNVGWRRAGEITLDDRPSRPPK